jgi:hypothetical protein
MGREAINIRSWDMVVIVGGRTATLGEFAIAYDEGRLIGVLTGTGGVADLVADLTTRLRKDTGAAVLYDDNPERLVQRLISHYRHFTIAARTASARTRSRVPTTSLPNP